MLLGAANVVGGLWHASDDSDDSRGLELIAWGMGIIAGLPGEVVAHEPAVGGEPLAHLTDLRVSVRERTNAAAAKVRTHDPGAAVEVLDSLLVEIDDLNAQESARIRTLATLANLARQEPRLAVDAMDMAVSRACSVICSPDSPFVLGVNDPKARDVGRHKIQFATYQVLLAARNQLKMGRVDRVVRTLGKMIDTQRASPTTFKALSPAGGLKQSRRFRTTRLRAPDLVALQLMLARAHMSRDDVEAAIESYETVLEIEGGFWQLDITLENLANLHFEHGNFERSLNYQRAWLRDSDWVGRACPEVCALPQPGRT
ncbi:MAG: hypothetical protein J4F38_05360 [Pseudomonadales bacterium]|nr:hypothetical protein [Pseudomonadales bacterium]